MRDCNGSGELACEVCGGAGDLSDWAPRATSSRRTQIDPCSACGGTGFHACTGCEDCGIELRWGLDLEDFIDIGGEGGYA